MPTFPTTDWYRALTLRERGALQRTSPRAADGDDRLYRRWKEQRPFSIDGWFERRLAAAGLDDDAFRRTLALGADDLHAASTAPAWLAPIESAFAGGAAPAGAASLDFSAPRLGPTAGFLNLVRPLIEDRVRRLERALAPVAGRAPLGADIAARLIAPVVMEHTLRMLERTMVLELHVARLEERLSGETSEERFADFTRQLTDRDVAVPLLSEYPVLARQIVERADDAFGAGLEFMERLVADWAEIRERFFAGGDPGDLVAIDTDAGDAHRGGHSVVIATFASGAKVVYKPRSLAADAHFQDLLAWINARVEGPAFHTFTVLDRGGHGWMEFVEARPCESRDEVARYHHRVGGLLAVLYAVHGVDCHFENLIAHGEHPVPVDLESLFHPEVPRAIPKQHAQLIAYRVLGRSVLRIGLLPLPISGADDVEVMDLSGVASVEGAVSPDRVLQWDGIGTDAMHAVRENPTMVGSANRPTLHGADVDVGAYRDDIVAGFQSTYRLLMRHRDELLAGDGPVEAFANDTVRAVLRPTRAYGMLLHDSFHPDLLRDALDRDRYFDRLWVGIEEQPALERVVAFEHRDLWRDDVPYFTSSPSSRDLWAADGERIPDFFPRPALDSVRERIRDLSEADLERQTWLAVLSIGARTAFQTEERYAPVEAPPTGAVAPRERALAEAARVADRLQAIAEHDGDDVTWVTLEYRNQRWLMEPCSIDLYVGLPGIALFLAYLGDVTGSVEATRLARAATGTLLRIVDDAETQSVGVMQGWGGPLYALAHLASLWREPGLARAGENIIEKILALAPADEDIDVVGGLAGAVGAMCAMHAATGSDVARAAAVRCGELMLQRATRVGGRLVWHSRLGGETPQSGFSHGHAGIGWALHELAAMSGDGRFARAGDAAIDFERDRLDTTPASGDTAGGNPGDAADLDASWCYGAAGIGMAWLRDMRRARDGRRTGAPPAAVVRDELRHLVDVTFRRGFGSNHCLCHGDLGSLDFLTQAHAMLGDGERPARVDQLTARVLASIERYGFLCGTPGHLPSPGMMNGLAGIGYGLLRLAAPERVPSVLLLQPPRRR